MTSGNPNPETERARIIQSNEVAGIVIDVSRRLWPGDHVDLSLRYGIADAMYEAGYRKVPDATPAAPRVVPVSPEADLTLDDLKYIRRALRFMRHESENADLETKVNDALKAWAEL